MKAKIWDTIRARMLGLSMQIRGLPSQRTFQQAVSPTITPTKAHNAKTSLVPSFRNNF